MGCYKVRARSDALQAREAPIPILIMIQQLRGDVRHWWIQWQLLLFGRHLVCNAKLHAVVFEDNLFSFELFFGLKILF